MSQPDFYFSRVNTHRIPPRPYCLRTASHASPPLMPSTCRSPLPAFAVVAFSIFGQGLAMPICPPARRARSRRRGEK